MKPFKSIDEQIDILKSRNLKISDEANAKRYLHFNNYYNVINCYSKYFLDTHDKYVSETDFKDIEAVHHFDKEIKSVLFKYIIEAEKHFKSVFSYRYCERYRDIPYAYFDINNYNTADFTSIAVFISVLSKIITRYNNASYANSIKHYVNNHSDVPFWVLSNYMTFGQLFSFFSYMPDSLKNLIARDMSALLSENIGIPKPFLTFDQLESFLKNIIDFRNILAHNNKLLGHLCHKNTKYCPDLHGYFKIPRKAPRQNLYNTFIALNCFLNKNQYRNLNNNLYKKFKELESRIDSVAYEKIVKELGFYGSIKKI